MSKDSGGDNMAGTSQVCGPPHGQTSNSTQPVPPPPSDKGTNKHFVISNFLSLSAKTEFTATKSGFKKNKLLFI